MQLKHNKNIYLIILFAIFNKFVFFLTLKQFILNLFASKIKNKIPFKISKTLKNAIRDVYHDIFKFRKKFGTILLSPAAASFDQFKNFEERGDCFKSIIKNNLKYFKYV